MLYKLFGLITLTLLMSFDASGQACGYSINTLYVNDQAGNPVKSVKISVVRKDPRDEYTPHFQEASKTYWDDERKAYVYQHGLCSAHRDLLLRVSAEGFDVAEHQIDLPLGWQAFAVTLKRKGTNERAIFNTLSCSEETTVCVKKIIH